MPNSSAGSAAITRRTTPIDEGSTERILTTHVGSLPRSQAVTDVLFGREKRRDRGQARGGSGHCRRRRRRRTPAGRGRRRHRERRRDRTRSAMRPTSPTASRDSAATRRASRARISSSSRAFSRSSRERGSTAKYRRPRCIGEITPQGFRAAQRGSANFRRAIDAGKPTEGFHERRLTRRDRPVSAERLLPDARMPTSRRSARPCGPEYEAIVGAGFLLQIDAPDLGMGRHTMYRNASVGDYLKAAARHVEVLNHALRNLPADRMRMHICWGNYEGPHHHDVPLEQLLPVVIKAKPQALLFESANPRHAHEWAVFKSQKVPDDKILVPGRAQHDDELRRTSGARRGTHRAFRGNRRPRARDRRDPIADSARLPDSAPSTRTSST